MGSRGLDAPAEASDDEKVKVIGLGPSSTDSVNER